MPAKKSDKAVARYRPRVGDTRWIVEWCIKAGMVDEEHPEYGGDPDKNMMLRKFCDSKNEAERTAKEVYPADQFGAVSYWPVEFVAYDPDDARMYPHAGYWEATADSEYYEGENRTPRPRTAGNPEGKDR